MNDLIKTALGEEPAELVLKNGAYLNVFTGEFEMGDVAVACGRIAGIGTGYSGKTEIDITGKTIVPGFIDGHIHLESSIIAPDEFARAAARRGTTAVVTDPHEIVNVMGMDGMEYMLQATENLPIDVFFMVPSCVPATPFDESGAEVGGAEIREYLKKDRVLGLAEMMNYPGLLGGDPVAAEKVAAACGAGMPADGHGPGLTGKRLAAYVAAGIDSDHECTSFAEGLEKLKNGQWIMIREGTAGRNLQALLPLLTEKYAARCLFVCDDKHPSQILKQGHIDHIIRSAIAADVDPAIAYTTASFRAAQRFGLSGYGAIAPGYRADFVVVGDVRTVATEAVYKDGICVYDPAQDGIAAEVAKSEQGSQPAKYAAPQGGIDAQIDPLLKSKVYNTVHLQPMTPADFRLKKEQEHVIGLIPGEIITTFAGEAAAADAAADIVKVCVVERHKRTGHIGVAFMKGYGLKRGAVATSVAHDSHNIIAAGIDDAEIAFAVNRIIAMQGGMVAAAEGTVLAELALPVAGLMCEVAAETAVRQLEAVKTAARALGVSEGIDPFMTLSFVSLPVIPELKLTTLGLVDVTQFRLI